MQDVALNGAQVSSLLDIIAQVAERRVPRESGVQMIATAFQLPLPTAERMLGDIGRTFFAMPTAE